MSIKQCITALCLLLFLSMSCLGQDLKEQMSAETQRLKKVLSTLNLSEEEAKNLKSIFKLTEDALQSGHLYLGLYRLQRAREFVMAFEYSKSKAEIEKLGVDGFEKEWQRLGQEMAEKERLLNTRRPVQLPLIARALTESSLSQVQPYYQSGRLYGLNTTIGSGFIYLGLASANLDFVQFCRQLGLTSKGVVRGLRSLEPELTSLEAQVVKAFGQPEAASQQVLYIRANATLKLAADLNREKRFAGALYKYLEACREFAAVSATDPDAQRLDLIRSQIELFRTRLSSGNTDHSLGLFYLEMAQSALASGNESPGNKEDLKKAATVIEQVLPTYFKLIDGVKK
jgi:hypothetical protein